MSNKVTINVGGEKKTLELFSSINELPIKRYQLLQKYSLIDAGVGSTYDDVLRHLARMDSFIKAGDMESVALERENLLMNYSFMLNENYVKTYSFAVLIKKIDGQDVDITDYNVDDYVDMLINSDITVEQVDNITELQKKTSINN